MTPAPTIQIHPDVEAALDSGDPVVALESTVISHGLPRPVNLETAFRCQNVIRDAGAIPATVGIINGQITIGLTDDELRTLALGDDIRKVSRRDYPIAVARQQHGATTVAGTMIAAQMAGIMVFATGGIGGVHRGDGWDVSADLPELASTPMAVVCAGAKSILDLPRTLEYLETAGVPVLGWGTDTFPAFYAHSSGLPVDTQVDDAAQAAAIIATKWQLELHGGVLVAVPPPASLALPEAEMEQAIHAALNTAEMEQVTGKDLTPFLLSQVSEMTEGRSLDVNVALLEQNARIAAEIAIALSELMAD